MEAATKDTRELFDFMSAAEHLEEAKNALADGYRPHTNPAMTAWGRVSDAAKHLGAIRPESPEYKEARKLMQEVNSRQRQIEKVSANVANHLMIKQREMLAEEFELHYLSRGIYVDIELSGPDKTFIKFMSPLLRETLVDRMINDTYFLTYFREAGFRRVTLADNMDYSWAYSFGNP